MGSDIVVIALIAVGGFLAYRYISSMPKDSSSSSSLPPPSANDTMSKQPVSATTLTSAQNDIAQNRVINNNYYVHDFDVRIGPIKKSQQNLQLLVSFNPDKYSRDSKYRRSVNIVINNLPNPRERDYWHDITEKLDIVQKPHAPKPRPQGGDRCVQRVMCMINTHWDPHQCKCVPNTVPMPNTTPIPDSDGHTPLVHGTSSMYSNSTLMNNPGRLFV